MALTLGLNVAAVDGNIVLTNTSTGYGTGGNPLRSQTEMDYSGVKVDKDGNEVVVALPDYDPFTDDSITYVPAKDGYFKFTITDGTDTLEVDFISTAKLEACQEEKEANFLDCHFGKMTEIDPCIVLDYAINFINSLATKGHYILAEGLTRAASAECDLDDECKGC